MSHIPISNLDKLNWMKLEKAIRDLEKQGVDTGGKIYTSGQIAQSMESLTIDELFNAQCTDSTFLKIKSKSH